MLKLSGLAVLATVMLLTGCYLPVTDPMPDESACGASDLQSLVGQSASVLETMRFGVVTRIIRPGDAVTMDYVPDRLNIAIDSQEIISRVSCG